MSKYRVIERTNGWIVQAEKSFNVNCNETIADQLNLREAYKTLLNVYNEENGDCLPAANWSIAVRQKRGARPTFPDGTRRYEHDISVYEIVELPERIVDLLKEEVQKCTDIELYRYKGNDKEIYTDYIEPLDDELDFRKLYCTGMNDFDFKVMDEEEYNNAIFSKYDFKADFDSWYGNKDARVLVVVLKNYNR